MAVSIASQIKEGFFDEVREAQRKRCEDITRQHYASIGTFDPYDVNEQLPQSIELLSAHCLDVLRNMFQGLEEDSSLLEGKLGVQKNDTLVKAGILDEYCSVFRLEFASGARIVYKDIPSGPYELWEYVCRQAGICAMDNLCKGEYLYSRYIERAPLGAAQSPQDYYFNLGQVFALLHLFGGGGIHTGNLCSVGAIPVVIDCDSLFHAATRCWRIARNGSLPFIGSQDYNLRPEFTPFYKGEACPYTQDGRIFYFEDYAQDIRRGYAHCAKNVIPQLHDGFMERVQGVKYRYKPIKEILMNEVFKHRIVFGQLDCAAGSQRVQAIMKVINQLKMPKFYARFNDDTLYYGDEAVGNCLRISPELLEYRFKSIPSPEDITIQFQDIDIAAKLLRESHESDGCFLHEHGSL